MQLSVHYPSTEQDTESADRKGQEVWKHTKESAQVGANTMQAQTLTERLQSARRGMVCVWATDICTQAGTRKSSVGEFCVYEFSLFETRSKFIIHPLCGGFVLSLKALTQCKHGVLKGIFIFFFFNLKSKTKGAQEMHYILRRKTNSWTVTQAHVAMWRQLPGLAARGTHGECMCGR